MLVVTVIERAPTRPKDLDIITNTFRFNDMFEVTKFLEEGELNFMCWVNVSITYIAGVKNE